MSQPRRKQSQQLDYLFSNRKIQELSDYLLQNMEINLIQLIDHQGNTCLHQLAYEGHFEIIKLFVRYAKNYNKKRSAQEKHKLYLRGENQEISLWMNQKNNEGFTALLYACYSGHIDIIRYLVEEYEVNYQLTTNTGLNPLHLAAQKNNIMPFIYFRKKIDINEVDKEDSTALHWASYLNSEEVVSYILADQNLTTLNKKDGTNGNTALLVAVDQGNTRVARRLLIKGANRYLKNNNGNTALDIAKEHQFKTISKMLNAQYNRIDVLKFYCNVKIQYIPKKRKPTNPIIFIIALFFNLAILNYLISFKAIYSYIIQGVIMFLMFFLYLLLLRGPTRPKPNALEDMLDILKEKDLKEYCFQCRIKKPKRGYHCDICGICIRQYDHHCTWINNCVGKRNIGKFMYFLFFLILSLGFVGLVSFLAETSILLDDLNIYQEWFSFRFEYVNLTERICLICLFALNLLTSLFVVPVIGLFIVQIKNLLTNRTTYEISRSVPQQPNEIKDQMRKYNSKVSLRNCKVMCNDNYSSFTSTRQQTQNELITDRIDSNYN